MKEKVLAVRGVGGYRQYRIPAMAVTPSGRIIAIYDARFDFDDLPSPIDLVLVMTMVKLGVNRQSFASMKV